MEPKKLIRLEEVERESPLRELPFTVPEGYFDTLPSRVQAEAIRRSHRFTISWSWQRTAASLAGAGLVAALVWVTYPQQQPSLGPDQLSEVSNRSIKEYLNEQNVSSDELADASLNNVRLPSDSTMLQYLNVSPKAIQQELDLETTADETI